MLVEVLGRQKMHIGGARLIASILAVLRAGQAADVTQRLVYRAPLAVWRASPLTRGVQKEEKFIEPPAC
jgi:hypothetical protein